MKEIIPEIRKIRLIIQKSSALSTHDFCDATGNFTVNYSLLTSNIGKMI